jgi:hypothetical protein
MADARQLLSVKPEARFEEIKTATGWSQLVTQFGEQRMIQLIGVEKWRAERGTVVKDGEKVTPAEAAEKLKVDPNVTYSAMKELSDDWRDLIKYFGKEHVVAVIQGKGWHVEDDSVFDRKGETVSTEGARVKLRGKLKKTLPQEDAKKEDEALGDSTELATQVV